MRGRSGIASIVLGVWASLVFVLLWAGAVIGLADGGELFATAWAWLTGLAMPAAVAAWILFLPACIGLWVTQAGLAAPAPIVVLVLLAAWTALAWGSLVRQLVARRG